MKELQTEESEDAQDNWQQWCSTIREAVKKCGIVLKKMKNNKAPGENGIRAEFLKALPKKSKQVFFKIVGDIWKENLPMDWETARICEKCVEKQRSLQRSIIW